jgi:hypothetical protein
MHRGKEDDGDDDTDIIIIIIIICLSNMCKILTGIIARRISLYLTLQVKVARINC